MKKAMAFIFGAVAGGVSGWIIRLAFGTDVGRRTALIL